MLPVKKEPETTPIPAPAEITPEELAELRARIESYEAADVQRKTGAFTGVARCVNQGCKDFDASKPIAVKLDVVENRAPDMPALVTHTSEYLHAVDDEDLPCPKCGVSRAIMPEEPQTYAAMAPR